MFRMREVPLYPSWARSLLNRGACTLGHASLGLQDYRGTSRIKKRLPAGPYISPMPRALWWSLRGGGGLMSKVPLYATLLNRREVMLHERCLDRLPPEE